MRISNWSSDVCSSDLKAEFEEAKRRAGGIEKWIEEQLKGTSVTEVLFGAETYDREWVRHEIKRSYELGKGLLAIDIHSVKDPDRKSVVQGKSVAVRVDFGGRRIIKTKKTERKYNN